MEKKKIVIQDLELNDEELDDVSGGAYQDSKKPCINGCGGYSYDGSGLCYNCYKKTLDNFSQIMERRKNHE